MIDQATLHELVGFQPTQKGAPTLSLYLDVDPRHRTTDEYRLALRHLLASVDGQATKEDCTRVERFIEKEYDRQSRGLACFSCVTEGFWHAIPCSTPSPATASCCWTVRAAICSCSTWANWKASLVWPAKISSATSAAAGPPPVFSATRMRQPTATSKKWSR